MVQNGSVWIQSHELTKLFAIEVDVHRKICAKPVNIESVCGVNIERVCGVCLNTKDFLLLQNLYCGLHPILRIIFAPHQVCLNQYFLLFLENAKQHFY